jgi:hypothetical protein
VLGVGSENIMAYLKLEAYWVLTNLVSSYDENQCMAVIGTDCQLLQLTELQLKELLDTEFQDLRLFNAVLWLLGNMLPTNKYVKETIANKTCLVKCLFEVFQKNPNIDSDLLETMLWVTGSVCQSKCMSYQVVDCLCQIF